VNYPFLLSPGDTILLTQASGSVVNEYSIISINQAPNEVIFNVVPPFPSNIASSLFSAIFLKRVKDETSIISRFRKAPGSTSYGFIIPYNLHPDVLANIDTITKEVKQKLLADQQGAVTG
jgi:cold shock CspA family protein